MRYNAEDWNNKLSFHHSTLFKGNAEKPTPRSIEESVIEK